MELLQSLPVSLVLLLLATPALSQEPFDIADLVKRFPEDESLVKRGLDSMRRLQTQKPIAVQKMSPDPEEMFFLDYWVFEDEPTDKQLDSRSIELSGTNTSAQHPLAPLRPNLIHDTELKVRRDWTNFFGPNPLVKRFQCPTNYNECSNIQQPNLCCPTGDSCFQNSAGTVGCCPPGATCGAGTNVGSCNQAAGYTPCPGANGGCCIPLFSCFDVGCK
jgi:progranulin